MIKFVSNGTNTNDADATANDIIAPKTAYVKGEKVTGNIATEKVLIGNQIKEYPNILTSTSFMTIGFSKDNKYAIKLDYNTQELVLYVNENNILNELKREPLSSFDVDSITYQSINTISFSNYGACESDDCVYVYVGLTNSKSFITVLNVKTYEFNYSINDYASMYRLNLSTSFGQTEPVIGKLYFTKTVNLCTAFTHDSNNYKRIYSYLLNKDGTITSTLLNTLGITDSTHLFDVTEINNGNVLEYNLNSTGWDYDNPSTSFARYLGYVNGNTITFKSTKETNIYSISGKYATNGNIIYDCVFDTFNRSYSLSEKFTLDKSYNVIRFISDNIFLAWTTNKNLIFVTLDYDEMTSTEYQYTLTNPLTVRSSFFTNIIDIVSTSYTLISIITSDVINKITIDGVNLFYPYDANSVNNNNVLQGKTFYNINGKQVGTMPNNGELNYGVSNIEQTIPAGYTSGGTVAASPITQTNYNSLVEDCKEILGKTILSNNLNYIESTGTQYIDTGVIPNNNTIVELSIKKTGTVIDYERICGIKDVFEIMREDTANFMLKVNNSELSSSIVISNTEFTKLKFGNGSVYVDDILLYNYSQTFTTTNKLFLFFSNGSDRYGSFQLEYCKIYNDNVLVKDLVPSLDDNNISCLYDNISKTYLYNQGTNTFISGQQLISNDLIDYINEIELEKNNNLLPENIKSGVEVLGVTGTYEGTSSTE